MWWAGFGGCGGFVLLLAGWLARQLQSKKHRAWQRATSCVTEVPARLTATATQPTQPASEQPLASSGVTIRPVRKRFADACSVSADRTWCVYIRVNYAVCLPRRPLCYLPKSWLSISPFWSVRLNNNKPEAVPSPQILGRGDPGTRVGLAYHLRRPMTAPETAAFDTRCLFTDRKAYRFVPCDQNAWDGSRNRSLPEEPDITAVLLISTGMTGKGLQIELVAVLYVWEIDFCHVE